jgi:hypothetical protein
MPGLVPAIALVVSCYPRVSHRCLSDLSGPAPGGRPLGRLPAELPLRHSIVGEHDATQAIVPGDLSVQHHQWSAVVRRLPHLSTTPMRLQLPQGSRLIESPYPEV